MLAQGSNIINFLIYLAVALPLLGLGITIFRWSTPYKEFQLLGKGSHSHDLLSRCAAQAAAYDLGGKAIGLALVMASAIFHSVSILDLIIWGIIGIIFQVLVFYVFGFFTAFKVVEEIPQGNTAVGFFSFCMSIATGLLMAALISY